MPKKSRVADPNNVRNPFATKPSLKTEADEEGSTKKRQITEVNLTEPQNEGENPDTPVTTEVKEEPNFNLYVGTEIGILKGIAVGGELPISKNVYLPEMGPKKPPGVVALSWTDDETEKELLVCFSNHVVKTYNTKMRCFTRQILLDVEPEGEKIVSLCCQNSGKYVFGLGNGTLGLWSCRDASVALSIKTCNEDGKSDLRKVCQCTADKDFFATGGKENELKIWNLGSETPDVPVFKAKNVPHDFLDLRVPVWNQDLTFLPRTTEVVAVGTRYGQIRLYDVRAGQRPVSNVQFVDHPVMAITPTMDDRRVVVGTAKGEAGLYDLRNPGKEKLCLKYLGFTGSIRSMVSCPDQPYVVSSGLDRHLYIHKLTERSQIKKLYLKQQINCIAMSKSFMKELNRSKEVIQSGDWANIPPDVLSINLPQIDESSPSPPKRLRKVIAS